MSLKTEYEILQEEKRYKTIVNLLELISQKNDKADDAAILSALKANAELLQSLVIAVSRPTNSSSPQTITVAPADTKPTTAAVEKLSAELIKSNQELQRLYFKKEVISSFDVKYNTEGDLSTVIVNYKPIT